MGFYRSFTEIAIALVVAVVDNGLRTVNEVTGSLPLLLTRG